MTKCIIFAVAAVAWGLTCHAQTPADSTTVEETDTTTWSIMLDGVTVKAQQQLIKQEVDRLAYDVQADQDSKTQTVMDMLRKVPMVTVDGEDNILVKGNQSYKIYKNGHYDPMLSKNAKDVLKAMPASAIKRIEVVTDPGAREDAEGVNAILNIVMMDNKRMGGVTGTVRAAYNTLNWKSLGTYLATQLGKAVVSIDYGYSDMGEKVTKNTQYRERTIVNTGNRQIIDSEGCNPGQVHFADINASLDIDTLNLLSASFGGYFYKMDVLGGGLISMFDASGNEMYHYSEQYWMPSYSHHSWNGRMDYEHKMRRSGERLTLSYMLALTRQHTEQETNYSNMENFPFNYNGFLHHVNECFTEHTYQIDYVRPLWEGHKLEVGTKYIDRRNNSENTQRFYDDVFTTTSDAFDHSMQITAAYIDYLWSHAKWSARAGLRYEHSFMKGHYPDGKSADFDKHLNDWVPQASVKYQIDDRQSLKLVYTTSINRPGITYLNPAVSSYPMSVQFGNPNLGSTRSHSIGLPYMYVGQHLTLQLWPQYKFTNNALSNIIYADGDTRYLTYDNVLRQRRWQVESYIQWKPFDNTTFIANLNFSSNLYENQEQQLKQHCTSLNYYLYAAQMLPWKLQLSGYIFGQLGNSSQDVYTYNEPWNSYAFTLQRSFLSEDRLTVSLLACAPFHKDMHFKTRTTQGDILASDDYVNAQNGRYFRLSLSFRFGKLKSSVKKTDTTITNDDLQGGITRGK
ncbi:MAG: outer membrane beta-barrel protein [Muribaculaceae bacterium]|nr:outer membrane beta-barrel protein [Muribaculaceae bacterium]